MKKTLAIALAVLMVTAFALPTFATDTAVDLEKGLLSYYTFDVYDPVTQTFADSAKDNPVPLEKMVGVAYQSDGPVGKAVYFDGNTTLMAYEEALNGKLADLTTMTYSVWIYADKFPAESADKNRYFFTTQSWTPGDMHLQFVWGEFPGSCQVCISGNAKAPTGGMFEEKAFSHYRTPQLEAGKWNLFTITYDNNTNTIKYYANGALADSAVYSESLPIQIKGISVGNHYEIGKYPGFEGYLDDMRIYNRVLSETEILALAKMGNDTVTPNAESIADVTTAAPETKAPETTATETKAPETKAPETKAPETKAPETKAPETSAAAPEKKGCGSSAAAFAVIAAVIPAAVCVCRRKKD